MCFDDDGPFRAKIRPSAPLAQSAPSLQNSRRHRAQCSIRLTDGLPTLAPTRAQPVERQDGKHPPIGCVLFPSSRLGEATEEDMGRVRGARTGAPPGPARVRAPGFRFWRTSAPRPDPPGLVLKAFAFGPPLIPALLHMLGCRPHWPLNGTSGRSRRSRWLRRLILVSTRASGRSAVFSRSRPARFRLSNPLRAV